MLFNDFNYRDKNLSDFNCLICNFNGNSGVNITAGSSLSFTSFKQRSNNRFMIAESKFDQPLSATFQICKNKENGLLSEFDLDEVREITEWLQTEKYFEFQPFEEEYDDIFYEGTFTTISPITFKTKIYGLELTFMTDSPWAHGKKRTLCCDFTKDAQYEFILDTDRIGSCYPLSMSIELKEAGDFLFFNHSEENRVMKIANCKENERIEVDYTNFSIYSSLEHNVKKDFNYIFPHLNKSYDSSLNKISCNRKCLIKLSYFPIRKTVVV
ncbi:MAG: phage tail domain-containing protein [Beduini sp.]|uniref:phage tail domain-containing protein n=1 Tax=Beduini sp. TaxID=1922300 RepID=UPI0039A3B0BF